MTTPTPTTCRSCGAPIYWALTGAGKRMPVDAEPSQAGTVELRLRSGAIVAIVHGSPDGAGAWRTSHFATCPNADAHRRDKR